ncbi:chemotaxis protein CheX [Bdellovibrionota bacterium FG-2]
MPRPTEAQKTFLTLLAKHPDFLRTLVGGVATTLTTHLKSKPAPGRPFLRQDPPADQIDVLSTTQIKGQANGADFSLTLVLCLSEATFLKVYQDMFGEAAAGISSENQDLAGELLNMSVGSADPELKKLGYKLKGSIPQVLMGTALGARLAEIREKSIAIPLSTPEDRVILELML